MEELLLNHMGCYENSSITVNKAFPPRLTVCWKFLTHCSLEEATLHLSPCNHVPFYEPSHLTDIFVKSM